jgi:RimJ/RimL family protein N-acetyltransferase
MVILTSARLRYEFVTLKNVRSLWGLMSAPHLREYQDVPHLSLDRFRERVRARPPEFARGTIGRHEWMLRLLRGSEPIGWVSVRTGRENPYSGELGYTILRKYRRQGYATEAVQALIEAAFNADILDQVTAYCVPENTVSRTILNRLGLSEIRHLSNGAVVRGRAVDVVLHELDRMSWRRKT